MPINIPTILTMADMQRICRAATPQSLGQSGVISELRPEFSRKLQGSRFTFHYDDGALLHYQFTEDGLSWCEDGGEWHQEACECLESSIEGVYLIHHLRTQVCPYEAATLVLDTRTMLVTWVRDRLGNKNANRDVNRTVVFGAAGETTARHAKTDAMVGCVIDWKFANDVIIHSTYETEVCCAFVSPPPAAAPDWQDFFATFNPSRYVQIADGLYLLSFYAPGASGMEVSMLMDLVHMRAVGAAFGVDRTDTLRSYTFGARGARAPLGFIGRYTID
jgi:hypothetical protein